MPPTSPYFQSDPFGYWYDEHFALGVACASGTLHESADRVCDKIRTSDFNQIRHTMK